MTVRTQRAIAIVTMAASLLATAHAAQGVEGAPEVHGSADAFATPGMALAWGVLRGNDDAGTLVVIRIVTNPAAHAEVTVTGSDPFTGQESVVPATARGGGVVDVRVPRAHFAAFPRTDMQFRAPGAAANATLHVYYLGVPDTTPEFNDEGKLEAYLRERLAQVRAGKPP